MHTLSLSLSLCALFPPFCRIKHGEYAFDEQYWGVVSGEAKDFITKLLATDPAKRLTAKQSMLHPWLLKGDHEMVAKHLEGTLNSLKGFNANRKFKQAAKAVILARRISTVRAAAAESGTAADAAKPAPLLR